MSHRPSLPDQMERWVDPFAQAVLGSPSRPGGPSTDGEAGPVPPVPLRPAPAALATLLGVLLIVFWTAPIRPYTEGVWEPADLIRLFVLALIVGALNPSVAGVVGTVLGATAAMAIQLFVLTEQASWTPAVVAALLEPAWSGRVLGALAIGLATIVAGHLAGTSLARIRAGRRSMDPAPQASDAVIRAGLTVMSVIAACALLTTILLRATATSAYVLTESSPAIHIAGQGDSIVAVTPESVVAGRVLIDIEWTGGALERWVSIEGPLTAETEAVLAAGYDPLVGGFSRLLPRSDELVHRAGGADLLPGRYAVVISAGFPEMGPDDMVPPPVPALDVRRLVVSGPGPDGGRAQTGGPIVAFGYLLGLAEAGWGIAGWVLVARRRRSLPVAVTAGVVGAALLWLLVGFTIGQSHSPF